MIPLNHPLVEDYFRVSRERGPDPALVLTLLWDRLVDVGGLPFPGEPGFATCEPFLAFTRCKLRSLVASDVETFPSDPDIIKLATQALTRRVGSPPPAGHLLS